MESGAIPIDGLSGGFDLQSTLESGQSYRWRREDGRIYESPRPYGGSAWYYTVADGEFVRARQVEGRLEWEATTDAAPLLRRQLRLDDDLATIQHRAPDDRVIAEAFDAFRGMRLVRDPPFPTLVSFICSAQMRVARIHRMVTALAEEYGPALRVPGPAGDERTYHGFPSAAALAESTEAELRDLGLGYRAPYVVRTAEMVAGGEHPAAARGMDYEDAREHLTRFVGVGDKVGDCVCLFSLGFLDAVPLDTWIRTAIEDEFPECARDGYAETSRAIRERFGPDPGYVQTYVFNHLRTVGSGA